MLKATIKTSINYFHIYDPFNLKSEDKKLTTDKKILGVVLFIFGSFLTAGGFGIFLLTTAYLKQKKIKEFKVDPQRPLNKREELAAYEATYNLEETINKIKLLGEESAKNGKKLGLFIGRQAHEALPTINEDKDVNWVSMDRDLGAIPQAERIHLKLDFNDPLTMSKIAHLFDKVVLDLSCLKFFKEDPWRHMGRLLKKDPEATLITEASGKWMYQDKHQLVEPTYFNGHVYLDEDEKNNPNNKLLAHLEAQKYLKTLFNEATLVLDKTYPYKATYSKEVNFHFILKGPKYPQMGYFKFQQDILTEKAKKAKQL